MRKWIKFLLQNIEMVAFKKCVEPYSGKESNERCDFLVCKCIHLFKFGSWKKQLRKKAGKVEKSRESELLTSGTSAMEMCVPNLARVFVFPKWMNNVSVSNLNENIIRGAVVLRYLCSVTSCLLAKNIGWKNCEEAFGTKSLFDIGHKPKSSSFVNNCENRWKISKNRNFCSIKCFV